MKGSGPDRRSAIALSAGALAAQWLPLSPAIADPGTLLFLDPELAGGCEARNPVLLDGDPIRIWHASFHTATKHVEGITRWSDYLALRGLAADAGLRIRREVLERSPNGLTLVRWSAS